MSSSLADILSGTLSADGNIRKTAELELTRAIDNPDVGVALAQLLLSQDAKLSLRQISTALRRFVSQSWSPLFQQFKGPRATPPEVKAQIRPTIFNGLSDPKRQIRSLCASIISNISSADWPDEYPTLLTDLLSLISTGSPDSVQGALEVFVEFVQSDLTEEQLLPVLRDLLPALLNILGATERYSPVARARTIVIFRQAVSALYMVKGEHAASVKEATNSILPVWLEAFKVLLNIDPQTDVSTENWDGLRVRMEIYHALQEIFSTFSRLLAPYLSDFLDASLRHFQVLFPTLERYYLLASDLAPTSPEDGRENNLPLFITAVMDFVGEVSRAAKARSWFTESKFDALVSILFKYTQMTDDEEEKWINDANSFAAQEEELSLSTSMRMVGFDLFASLMLLDPVKTVQLMQSNLSNVIQSSEQVRASGNSQWWRPLEAAMGSIGSQASTIQELIDDEQEEGRPSPINIEHILTDVIPSVLNLTEYPFLQGRGFIFVSQFAKVLPLQSVGLYLEAAIQAIEAPNAPVPVKVSAVRAVQNFAREASDEPLRPYAERIVKDLGPFILSTSEDSLLLVLETLSIVSGIDNASWLTPELANDLISVILEVYNKTKKADPMTLSVMVDLFETLSGANSPGVYETVVRKALPVLCDSIANSKPSDYWTSSSAVELIDSLAHGAPESGLGDGFFALVAPAIFKCVADAEDRDLIQNIIVLLTTMVRKDTQQVLSWSDSGRSGLEHIFAILAKILNSDDESGGLNLGELIVHLLRKAGPSVLPVLPDLLQAMVKRMTKAQTATFLQSLLIPFAFLINNQRDAILDLLENTQIDGRSGLDIFIQTFCENAETFQGDWPNRQATTALVQLSIAASSGRDSLKNLTVKGDLIIKPETENVVITRARAKKNPPEFTRVPFPVKAVKLLLNEFDSANESALLGSVQEVSSADDGDDDDDWEDDEVLSTNQADTKFLSDLLGPRGLPHDNDDILDEDNLGIFAIRDDEELRQDPIMQMDMDAHIKNFFRESAAQDEFRRVVEQLNVEEMANIQSILNGQ